MVMTQGFKGCGGGCWFHLYISPPKEAMRFFKMVLWASKDKGVTWFFKKGWKEELTSWKNSKGEWWRSIKGFAWNFEEKIESSGVSIRSTNSTLWWTKEGDISI